MSSADFDPANEELIIAKPRKEIVFIESDIADIGTLINGIGRGKEIVILDATQDGLHQIAQVLAGKSGIDAVHIMSHGEAGAAHLGSLILNSAGLDAYKDDLQAIRQGMSTDGDILLYGCRIGADGDAGFVQQLAIATGADVAASSDTTGAAAFGGNWELEVVSGQIETASVIDAQTASLYHDVLNINPGTITFNDMTRAGGNGLNPSADGTKSSATTDLTYRVDNNPAYQLQIDGKTAGVVAYTGGGQIFSSTSYSTHETELTFSFINGQLFTPNSISLANYNNFTHETENFIIRGYDASGNPVGGPVYQILSYGYVPTAISLANLGSTPIKTLKIKAADGAFNYLMIDSISISSVAPPAPKVSYISSPNANGTYKIGDQIDVQVNFDSAVDVTGTPQLTLETGTTDRVVNYLSGSGSSTLTFRYTVQAGDVTTDLDLNSSAIALNGGTIKSHANAADAVLTLPTPGGIGSLKVNKDIVVDGIAPTLAITSNKSLLGAAGTANDTAIITFTFSEDPGASFTSADITVNGGMLGALNGSGLTRTATFSQGVNGTATISVAGGKYADAAGNLNSASSSLSFTVDTVAPTVAISSSKSVVKAGDTATITFTFSEDPGATFTWNGSSGDVVVSGGTLSAISGSGTTRTATFTPAAGLNGATASITVNNQSYADTAGNLGGAGASPSITVDTVAPTVAVSSDKPSLKVGETATITFTFSEDPGASFDASDITVSGGTLGAIQGSGATRTAVFTPIANVNGGSATITVRNASFQDAAGNSNSTGDSTSLSYDTLAPNKPSAPVLATGDDSGSSNSDGVTNNSTLHLSGSADSGSTVKLYDGGDVVATTTASGGTYSFTLAGIAQGNHTYSVVAVDAGGNESAVSDAQVIVVDRTPSSTTVTGATLSLDTGASATDMVTREESQTISGTLSANLASGERVMVSLDNGATWSVATASEGANTWQLTGVTLSGSNTLKVQVVDLAGNGGTVYAHAYTLDKTAPGAPSTPDLDTASDSGSSHTDNITGVTLPSFSGTAEVGATVRLFDGGIEIGSDVAVDGTWHITTGSDTPLSQRTHYITAIATDLAGNSGTNSAPLEVTVITAGPATTVTGMAFSADSGTPGDFITNQTIQTVSGTLSANLAAGERVEVSTNGGSTWSSATSAAGSNTWSTFAALASGTHDIKVRVVDAVDNPGPVYTQAYTVDSVKPGVYIASSASTLKAGETATITFTFTEDPGTSFDSSDITVSGGTLSALSGTGATRTAIFTPDAGVNGGTASIAVKENSYQDLAGNLNTGDVPRSLTFDTLAPAASSAPDLDKDSDKGTSDTDNLTNQQSLVFKGTAEAGATVKLYDSDGTTQIGSGTATGGNWTIATSTLGQGSHSVTAKVTDAAGNVSAVSGATVVTIDTTRPTLAIASDVSQLKIGQTAGITFTFSEDPGTSFTDADVAVSGGTLSALSGTGTVRTAIFTPAANTNGGTAGISVAASAYQDAAGNDGTAGVTPSLHFDTLAPSAPSAPILMFDNGLSDHDGVITVPQAVFTGSAESFSTVTVYDAGTGEVLGSISAGSGTWMIMTNPMSEGTHQVYAVARDAAGNVGPASASTTVTIDTVAPPHVTISSDVSRVKIGETATITFTFAADPGTDFSLANIAPVSAGSFGPLSGTGLTRTAVFTPYPDHDLDSATIRIVDYHDAAGNFTYDYTSLILTVDTKAPLAPSTPVLKAASDTGSSSSDRITSDSTPVFSGTKDFGTTVTLYDSDGTVLGSVYELIPEWSIKTTALSEGTHTITAKQTDSLGNVSVLSSPVTIIVDTHADALAAPVLAAASDSGTKGDGITKVTTPTLTGSAEAYATVTLYDSDGSTVLGTATADAGGAWSITSSALAAGAHDLSVRQVDLAGNGSAASPVLHLNVDDAAAALAAPVLAAASDSGAAGDGITKNTTPVFSGTAEALAQVTLYDGATAVGSVQADADGAWQITAATLADGVHAITARQVDRAGNESAAGTAFSLTVDTTAPGAPSVPKLKPASDTGNIGDGLTEDTNPVFEGTAQANTLVTLYETDGKTMVKLGAAMADASGKWSIAAKGMALGVHTLSATQIDAAGNESAASNTSVLRIMAPPSPVSLIDGMPVNVQPISLPGNVQGSSVSIPVVGADRTESSGKAGVADIPLATSNAGGTLLLAQLAPGYGLSASGASVPAASAAELLIASIKAATPTHAPADQGHLTGNGQSFLAGLGASGSLLVETVKPVSSAAPSGVLTLSGPAAGAGQSTALVIDAGGLATGATIALQQVNFAAVIGAAKLTAGSSMVLSGDGASQQFTVAAGGKGSVFAGGGNDVLGVAAAPAAGPAPAAGTTLLHGGTADDAATFSGARADYNVEFHNGYVMVSNKATPDVKAMVVNVEQLQFSDTSIAVQNSADMGTLAGIYQTVLGRQADVMGIEYWANVHQAGASWGAVALSMIASSEHVANHDGFNGVAAHDLALLYTAIFNRDADAGGMAYWTAAMARGMSLEQVASSFVQSVEMVGHQRAATDWDFSVG